jgi:hypothetical protein
MYYATNGSLRVASTMIPEDSPHPKEDLMEELMTGSWLFVVMIDRLLFLGIRYTDGSMLGLKSSRPLLSPMLLFTTFCD